MARSDVRFAILGAGPAALAVALDLAARADALVADVRVVDGGGRWLARWDHQLRALDATWLRSPVALHPHPDPQALIDFIADCGEPLLHEDATYLPTVDQFDRFTRAAVERHGLAARLHRAAVTALEPGAASSGVQLDTGERFRARHVVLATNPRVPTWPSWAPAGDHPPCVRHSSELDLRTVGELSGRRVLVIGGGLTAALLALGACGRGAHVQLCSRHPHVLRRFDFEPGWIAPRRLHRFLEVADAEAGLRAGVEARRGGSIPAAIARQLRAAVAAGALGLSIAAVAACTARGDAVQTVLEDGRVDEFDDVWLATGYTVDTADALLGDLAARHPCPLAAGLPLLDEALRWPGTSVHVTGPLAVSRLGATAGNLHGHRWAARRITDALLGPYEPAPW